MSQDEQIAASTASSTLPERQSSWRDQYGRHTAALTAALSAYDRPEGMFNQALTNGLLAIAHHHGVSCEAKKRKGQLAAANELLDNLRAGRDEDSDGSVELVLPAVDGSGASHDAGHFTLPVELLKDAIGRTDAPRHGRGDGGTVTDEDLANLLHLDGHPALRVVSEVSVDEKAAAAMRHDYVDQARAVEYLELLDDEEVERRVEDTTGRFAPAPGDGGEPLQECPVCENLTLVPDDGDFWAYGITSGICLVCSYQRSSAVAYQQGLYLEIDRGAAKDN